MPCTRLDFDGALFNFRIFLKLGAPTCLGPGASCPPAPLWNDVLEEFNDVDFNLFLDTFTWNFP